jgi:hypothetical protein
MNQQQIKSDYDSTAPFSTVHPPKCTRTAPYEPNQVNYYNTVLSLDQLNDELCKLDLNKHAENLIRQFLANNPTKYYFLEEKDLIYKNHPHFHPYYKLEEIKPSFMKFPYWKRMCDNSHLEIDNPHQLKKELSYRNKYRQVRLFYDLFENHESLTIMWRFLEEARDKMSYWRYGIEPNKSNMDILKDMFFCYWYVHGEITTGCKVLDGFSDLI